MTETNQFLTSSLAITLYRKFKEIGIEEPHKWLRVEFSEGTIYLFCSSRERSDELLDKAHFYLESEALQQCDRVCIVIQVEEGERRYTFPPRTPIPYKAQQLFNMSSTTTDSILTPDDFLARLPLVGDYELEHQCQQSEYVSKIIRMVDGKGLYCTSDIIKVSGARPNLWRGNNQNKYHLPDQLAKYVGAIYENAARNRPDSPVIVEYVSPNYDGQLFQRKVSVRLVNYGGDLCRLVESLELSPITF